MPNFTPNRCNVSTLRDEKPQNRHLSKLNIGALRNAASNQLSQQQPIYNNPFNGPLSRLTRVSQYQWKHSLSHTLSSWHIITFLHFRRPQHLSCIFVGCDNLFLTSLQLFFGLPLGLTPSTSKSMHFFTESFSSFLQTYHAILTYVGVYQCNSIIYFQSLSQHHTSA